MSDLELLVLGPAEEMRFPLHDGEALIVGRDKDCDVQLTETQASRSHCKVWRDGVIIRLNDLGSSNGTMFEGTRLSEPVTMAPGQVFKIGETQIALVEQGHTPRQLSAGDTAIAEEAGITQRAIAGDTAVAQEPEFPKTVALEDYEGRAGGESVSFRLIGVGGEYDGRIFDLPAGEVIVGREADCTIQLAGRGLSSRHARLLVLAGEVQIEDTSSNGTLVDGTRVNQCSLVGGERVSFATLDFRLDRRGGSAAGLSRKSSDKLAESSKSRRLRQSATDLIASEPAVGGMLRLVVFGGGLIVLLGLIVHYATQENVFDDPSVKMTGKQGQKSKGVTAGSAEEQMVLALLKRHDYSGAAGLIQAHPDKITQRVVNLYTRHLGLFEAMLANLRQARDTRTQLKLFDFTDVRVVTVSESMLTLSIATATGGQRLVKYKWADLASSELMSAYQELELSLEQPLAFASFAGFLGHKKKAFDALRKLFLSRGASKDDVAEIARELDWTPGEVERLIAREYTPIAPKPVVKPPPPVQRPVKRTVPKEDPKVVERRILAEAGEIMSLTRLFRYTEAESALKELIEEVETASLKQKLTRELEVLQQEKFLFEALLKQINREGIPLEKTTFEAGKNLRGRLAEATEDKYTIRMARGRISDRWRYLQGVRLMGLFELLPQSSKNLLGAGIFAYERGNLKAANRALINFYLRYPNKRGQLDRYLAFRIGIAPPQGGFRPYKGRLVTPEEQDMRSKGLVRYQGQWVTPEDKKKLESGFVKYKGEWVPLEEKKLYERGMLKYEGKWYAKAELNKIRSDWEKAWVRETKHYRIRSNMDYDYVEEVAKTLEAAYKNYKAFFGGKEPAEKMNALVFRTYQDWQKWCLDNKRQQLLGAAGVAIASENRFACWNQMRNAKLYFRTIVHEGSHLFHGRAYTPAITSWYAEGMATYHEAHEWVEGTDKLKTGVWNGPRYRWLKRFLNTPDWLPLDKLMSGNALASINKSRKAAMAFYSEAWGLFYFLSKTENKKWREGFVRFRRQIDQGYLRGVRGRGNGRSTAAKSLLEKEVGAPVSKIEAAMKVFFANGQK